MNSMSYDHPCWWEKLGSWMKGSSLWICGEDAKVNEPIYTFFFPGSWHKNSRHAFR